MIELRRTDVGVIRVIARHVIIDDIAGEEHGLWRLAFDEAIILCEPGQETTRADEIERRHERALVIADGDSFSSWSVVGPDADDALSRLCAIRLPILRPALLQGLVAELPAKVLMAEEHATVLVASTAGHHIRARAVAAWVSLGLHVVDRPAAFDPTVYVRLAV